MSIELRFNARRGGFHLDVDFALPARGVSALFGPSGSGKTSVLRAVAGLDRIAGRLLVDGDVWQEENFFLPVHRRPIGYVFQEASLFPHLTVRQNVAFGFRRMARTEQRMALETAIELLGIAAMLERKTDKLSGGERQRVAIARALAVSPRLLLMDEPLSALDITSKQEIMPFLETLHRELEIPVIYVSHSPDEVARLADHMVLMAAGRVEASGDTAEILTRLDLSPAHGGDAETLIEAVVSAHDESYQLTYLEFAGGTFTVARKALPVGSRARLRVAARDVSITLERQTGTSILNIFPATIEEIIAEGASQVTLRLLLAGVPMLARITRKSAEQLALAPGKQVFAQAKSVALLS